MAEGFLVLVLRPGDAGDRLFRHDEDVDGGLRADVAEGDADIVLVDDIGGDLAGDDAFEEGHGDDERMGRGGVGG